MKLNKFYIEQLQICFLSWYKKHHRRLLWRETSDPYKIWVSEVMLQQTQVNTVIPYYEKFLQQFPDLQTLADSGLQKVLKIWEGLGYYARARNLHKAAKIVVKDFAGKVPADWNEFRKLPGVGEYIASAVQSIAFGQPYAVVDGNVKRVLARLFLLDEPINQQNVKSVFKKVALDLLDKSNAGMHNQAVMELGALICSPRNPKCEVCPVQKYCFAFQQGKTADYPKRIKKEPVPVYQSVAGVLRKDGKFLITRRKPEGLLGGLWEFPGGRIAENEDASSACIRKIKEKTDIIVNTAGHLTRVKHAYTHYKIEMDVFYCDYVSGEINLKGPVDFRWIDLDEIDDFAFPKSNLKFILLIKSK